MQTAINNSSSPRHLGYGNIIFLGFIFKFQLLFHTIRIIFISNFELYVPRVFDTVQLSMWRDAIMVDWAN